MPLITNVTPIRPPVEEVAQAVQAGHTVPWQLMFFTIGAIVVILFVLIAYILLIWIFGDPMIQSKNARFSGKGLIMHFETPKVGFLKLGRIEGGAIRHEKAIDGTLYAIPKGVYSIQGRQLVLAYSLLGVIIPVNVLAGISVLISKGLNNMKDTLEKYAKLKQGTAGTYIELDNTPLLKGYDFENFETTLTQAEHGKLVPFSIETVPNFIQKNTNTHFQEKRIQLGVLKFIKNHAKSQTGLLISTAIAVLIMLLGYSVVK